MEAQYRKTNKIDRGRKGIKKKEGGGGEMGGGGDRVRGSEK